MYAEFRKGIYVLQKSVHITHDEFVKNLEPFGYSPMPVTTGLWRHKVQPISFTLVGEYFGSNYTKNAEHLLYALGTKHRLKMNWEGIIYFGINLKWNNSNRTVNLSIPVYVEAG